MVDVLAFMYELNSLHTAPKTLRWSSVVLPKLSEIRFISFDRKLYEFLRPCKQEVTRGNVGSHTILVPYIFPSEQPLSKIES